MVQSSARWTVDDKIGERIYLTQEHWEHIIEPINHPEMADYEEELKQPNFNYDELSDTLYVSFEPGAKATGIELNNNILLRIDKDNRKAVGITFLDFSLLAQRADFGPRSFPLTGLAELSDELRELVLEILQNHPVKDILTLSTYTPTYSEAIPITSLQHMPTTITE